MSQKNINKSLLVFSLLAAVIATAGCGTADATPATTDSVDTGAVATTPTDTGAATGDAIQPGTPDTTTPSSDTVTPPVGDSTTPPAGDTTTPPPSNPPPTTPEPAKSSFKDGSYTAVGDYTSPGGSQQIAVTLTISGDVVTGASATAKASDPQSDRYQDIFIGGFKQFVVGKKLAEINVTKVSGSSLTGIGFNDAVSKIKVEAKNS